MAPTPRRSAAAVEVVEPEAEESGQQLAEDDARRVGVRRHRRRLHGVKVGAQLSDTRRGARRRLRFDEQHKIVRRQRALDVA